MRTDFNNLPNEAKVWMYQSASEFSSEELKIISDLSEVFLGQWKSHGLDIQGSVDVISNRFIRIAAHSEEENMCGRAQDAQVRLVKELEEELKLQLTNRMLLAYEDNGQIKTIDFSDVEKTINGGKLTPNSIFFNNLIASKEEFSKGWKQEASKSWIGRFF